MSHTVKITLNEDLYKRDPEQTPLGRSIISESIRIIDEIGFASFTFKKLAASLNITEASIYPYFEHKHQVLVYLISWYWGWLEALICFYTRHVKDPEKKLSIIIEVIARADVRTNHFIHIDQAALFRIVVVESRIVYHTLKIDADSTRGFFEVYQSLCKKVAQVVIAMNPLYPYPYALVTTLFEAGKQQVFLARHSPSMTEGRTGEGDDPNIAAFLQSLAFSSIYSPCQ